MNEGAATPTAASGAARWPTTSARAASLHRLDPDGSASVQLTGVTISNGLEWSPDGALAYYNDTQTGRVDVFDYDRESGSPVGALRAGRRGRAPRRPDGRRRGRVWTAIFDQGVVHRYDRAGRLGEVVEVEARQVTACTFGGPALGELYVTTSREGLEEGDDPLAGSLFRVSPGVRGLPVREFTG
ncbi:SMP-30/gluconolactonase/LRE family protein [Janibacter melonis]|uniref:SMP-30/gluconolactonase/LRE family protein n=1 Tax=Janibacter melonis TaxID=262209 RepID=UPI0020962DAE|nr:SMP-30/gluconolactonase/LRE family protein [Janibacter melonis]